MCREAGVVVSRACRAGENAGGDALWSGGDDRGWAPQERGKRVPRRGSISEPVYSMRGMENGQSRGPDVVSTGNGITGKQPKQSPSLDLSNCFHRSRAELKTCVLGNYLVILI